MAFLCPFGTPVRGVSYPRKISRAERSRATLRHELARPQDRRTPAHAAPRHRDAACPTGSAEPPGADARPAPAASSAGRTPVTRQARPGRPPSRRRSRPRATGTSGSGAGLQRSAARTVVCRMNRTCVRTVGARSDGPMRTGVRIASDRPRALRDRLVHAGFRRDRAATGVAVADFGDVARTIAAIASRVFGRALELVC